MIKKILFIYVFSAGLLFSFSSHAQVKNESNTTLLAKEDQSLIKAALAGSIFVIRQDYILKSTNTGNKKEYGKGSNPYFGRIYGFGVLTTKKLWTDIKFKTPWTYDKNYIEFDKSDTMKPELSILSIKAPDDMVFSEKKYSIKDSSNIKDTTKQKFIFGTKTIFAYDINMDTTQKTIRSERNLKDSTGLLVIAYTSSDFYKNDSLPVNIGIYKTTLHFNDTTNEAIISKMPVTENIIGGAFFKTVVSPGNIDIVFSGIIIKKVLNWYVVRSPRMNKNLPKKIGNPPKENDADKEDPDKIKNK
jgi:hypothetical protein